MLGVGCWLLFVVCCLLSSVCLNVVPRCWLSLLFVVDCCGLFVVCYLPFVVGCSLLSLFVVCLLPFVPIVRCLLVVCCLLSVA